jgi:biopolymer transport protein TolR
MTSEINVTNLVDVSLTLVVIFILTAPLLKEGIEVNTPETEAGTSLDDISKAVVVSIDGDRQIYVNEDVVEEQFIGDRVKVEYDLSNESPVLLKAEDTLDYGYVVHVMDKIRAAGITKISLVTRPKQEAKLES